MRFFVIGNGPVNADLAALVDGCDTVVRMNGCDTHGGRSGRRTDLVAITNTGDLAVGILEKLLAEPGPARDCRDWLMPRDPKFYAHLRELLVIRLLKWDAYLGDATPALEKRLKAAGRRVHFFDPGLTVDLHIQLGLLGGGNFLMPSTGMICVEHCVDRVRRDGRGEVHVCGFGHSGWPLHPWAAEKRLFEIYEKLGVLKIHP